MLLVTVSGGFYWHRVVNGQYGPAINVVNGLYSSGSNIHIRVTANNNTYAVYLNGASTPATTLTDNTYLSGKVGLYDNSVSQTFDNVVVTEPTPAQSLSGVAKLLAGDGVADDQFGFSVSVDGDAAIVGAQFGDGLGPDTGAAYVFRRVGSSWVQEAKLTASDGAAGDLFGVSVSIDDDAAIVGANGDGHFGDLSGAAYVYRRVGSAWVEEAKLLASDGAIFDRFGSSVSISGDLVVIGSNGDDDLSTNTGFNSGAAYVYHRVGSAWVEEAKLLANDRTALDQFGRSVSIDGDAVIVGALYGDGLEVDSGAAYMYRRVGSAWVEEAKLLANDGAANDEFGFSVSISGDAVIVGARFDDGFGVNSGAAYVYRRVGAAWVEEAKLLASDGAANDEFGFSVSISGDAVIVGVLRDDDLGVDSGAAYVYHRVGSAWVEESKLLASDGETDDYLGFSVSISGAVAIVGVLGDDDLGTGSGAAYMVDMAVEITVTVPTVEASYNEQISIPVELSETTGADIVSAEVFTSYDGALLTALSVSTSNTLLTDNWSVETNIVQSNGTNIDTIKIAMATNNDVLVGTGTLINIDFQVADVRIPASSPLILEHVLFNDGTPGHATVNGSVILVGTDGTITSLPAQIIPRETITLTVVDTDADLDGAPGNDQVSVTVENTSNGDTVNLTLDEDGATAGTFSGTVDTEFGTSAVVDARLQAQAGDAIVSTYSDALDAAGNGPTDRAAQTDVLGGADGSVAITLVSQPGDPLYLQVTDADLNTNNVSAETASVTVENSRTLESFTVVLTEADLDDEVFFGSLPTTSGASTSTDMNTAEEDVVTATYDDVVTLVGDQQDRTAYDDVIDPWGDADDNEQLQAFDAAQVLLDVLSSGTHLTDLERRSANVDIDPVGSGINPYDASLILQKRVGLITTFEVQDPASTNHPLGAPASPKLVPEQRRLSLVTGDGYLSVFADEREDILSGDLTLEGIKGRVEMSAELASYLSASRATDDGLRIVFAGAEAVAGPGELLRIYGTASSAIELTDAVFNNGEITGTATGLTSLITPPTFALHPNVPNPFNPETTIRFELPHAAEVKLEVFDILGQKVRTLVTGALPSGTHSAVWHGRNDAGNPVGNGVYLYQIQAGEFTQRRRMLLLQ